MILQGLVGPAVALTRPDIASSLRFEASKEDP